MLPVKGTNSCIMISLLSSDANLSFLLEKNLIEIERKRNYTFEEIQKNIHEFISRNFFTSARKKTFKENLNNDNNDDDCDDNDNDLNGNNNIIIENLDIEVIQDQLSIYLNNESKYIM